MRKFEELAKQVLEGDAVDDAQVVKVVPTVRTNAGFPPPDWLLRPKRHGAAEHSVKEPIQRSSTKCAGLEEAEE